jgi:hypothetical protein
LNQYLILDDLPLTVLIKESKSFPEVGCDEKVSLPNIGKNVFPKSNIPKTTTMVVDIKKIICSIISKSLGFYKSL